MIALGSRNIVKEANQLMVDQILMEKREVFDGMEDDGIGEDGGIKQMGGKGG